MSMLLYPSKKAEKGLKGLRTMGGSEEDSWLATIRREPGFRAVEKEQGAIRIGARRQLRMSVWFPPSGPERKVSESLA